MRIGIDLDGTLSRTALYNPNLRLPSWLFLFLVPVILLARSNKEIIEGLGTLEGHEIIVVSARPPWAAKMTERWLRFHRVPFSMIYCVGFGKGTEKRKLRIIEETGISLFIDKDKRLCRFFAENSISARSKL